MIDEQKDGIDQETVNFVLRCTVKIEHPTGGGTGFSIAPGLILTCAHIIADKDNRPVQNDLLRVQWQGKEFTGCRIESFDLTTQSFQGIGFPDLALLGIDFKEIPYLPLYAQVQIPDLCYVYGFTNHAPTGEGITINYESPSFGERLMKFKEGQVISGFSGAPIFNSRTRSICGVLKKTRDVNSDLGGYGIHIDTIYKFIGESPMKHPEKYADTWIATLRNQYNKNFIFKTLTDLMNSLTFRKEIVEEVRNLPQSFFENEYAFVALYCLEMAFPAYEMSTLNKPPLIFWDREDFELWTAGLPNKSFHDEFQNIFVGYQNFFKNLINKNEKHYRIVLNYQTFSSYIGRKSNQNLKKLFAEMKKIISHSSKYELIFFDNSKSKGNHDIEEFEIISRKDSDTILDDIEGNTVSSVLKTSNSDGYDRLYFDHNKTAVKNIYNKAYDEFWKVAREQYIEFVNNAKMQKKHGFRDKIIDIDSMDSAKVKQITLLKLKDLETKLVKK